MDVSKLQSRLTEFMISFGTAAEGGRENMSDEAAELRGELDQAIAANPEMTELHDLVEALNMIQTLAENPAYMQTMADEAMKNHVPNPAIFDAIDDQDLGAIQAALKDWNINATHGEFDCTALYQAMSNMFGVSLPVVTLLLDAGADPEIGLGQTSNVLHGLGFGQCDDLSAQDLAEVIQRCMSLGADIEQRSNRLAWTPLITAASEWNPVATEALLMAGADINARAGAFNGVSLSGETALAFAEGHGLTKAVLDRYLTAR